MKKIIATVLAMVMALALCTTAFAASEYVLYGKDKKAITGDDGAKVMVTKTDASSKNSTTLYYKDEDGNYYIPATKDTFTNYVEGNYVEKLNAGDVSDIADRITYDGKLTKKLDKSSDKVERNCTTNVYDEDIYLDKDNKMYVKDASGDAMLFDGVILKVSDDVSAVVDMGSHLWIKGDKVSDGVYNVKCAICGATSVAYETLKLAGSTATVKYVLQDGIGTANDMDKAYEGELLADSWYVATAKTADPTTETNKSPKTFDAGIAMYVGMALTSVAGSALVIGKKKEF